METGYITAFWYLFISALTVGIIFVVQRILAPKSRYIGKEGTPYECGEEPVGSAWVQFNIRFYVVAIIFIIFDVELVALFPVAVLYKDAVLSGHAGLLFTEIFLFVGLLLVGLIYCWVRGDLEWIKGILPPDRKA